MIRTAELGLPLIRVENGLPGWEGGKKRRGRGRGGKKRRVRGEERKEGREGILGRRGRAEGK